MIQPERIKKLNGKPIQRGHYVLYWMQASQRAHWNHALEHAIQQANILNLPLIVYFGLTDKYPNANLRHFAFMLEGLEQTRKDLYRRNIQLILRLESPDLGVIQLSKSAALIVTDCGYLRLQKKWRRDVGRQVSCLMVQVETDVVVPVEITSGKAEYAAATIRKKIHRQLDRYLIPVKRIRLKNASLGMHKSECDLVDIKTLLKRLNIDRSVKPVSTFKGGTNKARKRLKQFITDKLDHYDHLRNDPFQNGTSDLSPYLHFGQISPLYVALEASQARGDGKEAFLEELIVRRELAINFIYYTRYYDSFAGLPRWAKANLKAHQTDSREYVYRLSELEAAKTHDPYWNAAQMEMVKTGKMHGYMRMYWGKKILEWCRKPATAYKWALYLNDKYELDGRDPNGYTGVAWCFGLHDRPWSKRPIFGNVRYMNDKGLKRKFDIDSYVRQIDAL